MSKYVSFSFVCFYSIFNSLVKSNNFTGKMFTEPLFKKLFPRAKWYPKPKHHQLIHFFLTLMASWKDHRNIIIDSYRECQSRLQLSRLIDYLDYIVPIVLNYGQAIRYLFSFLFIFSHSFLYPYQE